MWKQASSHLLFFFVMLPSRAVHHHARRWFFMFALKDSSVLRHAKDYISLLFITQATGMDQSVWLQGSSYGTIWNAVISLIPFCVTMRHCKVMHVITLHMHYYEPHLWSFHIIWALQECMRRPSCEAFLRWHSDLSFKGCKTWRRCMKMSSVNYR